MVCERVPYCLTDQIRWHLLTDQTRWTRGEVCLQDAGMGTHGCVCERDGGGWGGAGGEEGREEGGEEGCNHCHAWS